jgi:hypothetical protein
MGDGVKDPKWSLLRSFYLLAFGSMLVVSYQNCGGPLAANNQNLASSVEGSLQEPRGLPSLPSPVPAGGTIVNLKLESTASTDQTNVPFTLGHVFARGGLLSSETIAGKLSDGTLIPLQFDPKAKHIDGSIRHAVISGVIPKLTAKQIETLSLIKAAATPTLAGLTPSESLGGAFSADVLLTLNGVTLTASPKERLQSGQFKSWLHGPSVNEYIVTVPFTTSSGEAHPHLTARFAIRAYTGLARAKVDVVIENNWAYEPGPQNFTYDVQIKIGGSAVYSKAALVHAHHSRWKKTFWWGEAPGLHIRHDPAYLIATRALPNYDPSIVISEKALANQMSLWTGTRIEPMGPGLALAYMPTTGGRNDIGLLPSWGVIHLLSQDPRAATVDLGTADLAGSFPIHYRDRKTDLPLSIIDWPYSTLLGTPSDAYNPATKKSESFPACGGVCSSTNVPDSSHHPSLNYLPYLLTGDHYQLEELQFWAAFVIFQHNPGYRQFAKGLVKGDQVRGQAWSLRTLADAAYISPDDHPLKQQFMTLLDNNLEWFNATYVNDPAANGFGMIVNGYALGYNGNRGLAPWQDDFFTQAIGHIYELGFEKARPLLAWKAKFTIGRMTDPGFCWIVAGAYSLNVRDSATSPFYTSMAQAYQGTFASDFTSLACGSAEMAKNLGLAVGEMTGYASSPMGYPSNMQPALAYAAMSGARGGAEAWRIFINRPIKPSYTESPQFGIVPR